MNTEALENLAVIVVGEAALEQSRPDLGSDVAERGNRAYGGSALLRDIDN